MKTVDDAQMDQSVSPILGTVSAAQRRVMIAEAAYYRAEARDLEPGAELDDWLDAQLEADQRLSEHRPTAERSDAQGRRQAMLAATCGDAAVGGRGGLVQTAERGA